MTVAVSKAKERGAGIVICASTGNTSASAAAYAARAGMKCVVLLPRGNIALGKLAQALDVRRASPFRWKGILTTPCASCASWATTGKVEVVNSINPARIEGQKTASFEICDQLGRAPDFHFLPVGNAGNITAYWKGYREYRAGRQDRRPAAHVWFPGGGRGADGPGPAGGRSANRCHAPSASAIRPVGSRPRRRCQESNGFIDKVTRRGNSGRLQTCGAHRGHLCRAGLGRLPGRADPLRQGREDPRRRASSPPP